MLLLEACGGGGFDRRAEEGDADICAGGDGNFGVEGFAIDLLEGGNDFLGRGTFEDEGLVARAFLAAVLVLGSFE